MSGKADEADEADEGGEKRRSVGKRADLEITARADLSELRFTKVPETKTRFEGNVSRCSFSKSRRRNLPNEVQRDTDYREAGIEWKSVSRISDKSIEGGPEELDPTHVENTEHAENQKN